MIDATPIVSRPTGHWGRHVCHAGVTLIELMVAMVIGLVILLALLTLFLNTSRTNTEMARANALIENGRFAIQLLQNDLIHAGFWGELDYTSDPPPTFAVPAAIPEPCLPVANWDSAYTDNLLGIPVQAFADGSTLGACGVTGVLGTSEVLVVRHASTCLAGTAGCDGTGPNIQVSTCRDDTSPEALYVVAPHTGTFPLRLRNCTAVAPRRKVVTNIYYLANSGGLPTLMRASLGNGVWSAPQPMIDGIEHFRIEYGVDNRARNGLCIDGANPPDGSADEFISAGEADSCGLTELEQLANVVAVKVHFIARSLEPSPGHTDNNTYQLGATPAIEPAGDNFKRQVFSTTVRLVNPSGRREQP